MNMNMPMSSNRDPNFSQYCGKRVAVLLSGRERSLVFRGEAQCGFDKQLGKILAIREPSQADDSASVILAEAHWKGRIVADGNYGCQYCFIPASDDASPS